MGMIEIFPASWWQFSSLSLFLWNGKETQLLQRTFAKTCLSGISTMRECQTAQLKFFFQIGATHFSPKTESSIVYSGSHLQAFYL